MAMLLERTAALPAVDTEARRRLDRLRRKAAENAFEIALIGEFQGGKSTTFNALCDGRPLSPAGHGVKTSACRAAVEPLSDPEAPEVAHVRWRDSAQLAAGFIEVLLPHLIDLDESRFREMSPALAAADLNLDDPRDRRLVAAATERGWDRAGGGDSGRGDRLDLLRAAALAARYWGDPALSAYRKRSEFSLKEAGRMIVFPPDWEIRWADRDPARFALEEVLFAFIAGVRLRIRSENLGRLGCVLTDCPGLFASAWDSRVAREAMFRADAILYVMDAARPLKLSDLQALDFIRENGMTYKLFFGWNLRGLTLAQGERIRTAGMETLGRNGYPVTEGDHALYHARLSLEAVQADRALREGGAIEAELRASIQGWMAALAPDPQDPGTEPPEAWIRRVRRVAGLDRLMGMVEGTVVRKKARTLLLDNGACLARDALKRVEAALRSREEAALKAEKALRSEMADAEEALRKFLLDGRIIISRLEVTEPDQRLADDLWSRIADRRDRVCGRIIEGITSEVGTTGPISAALADRSALEPRITGIIAREIDRDCRNVVQGWVAEIKDRRHPLYDREIEERVRYVRRRLRRLWERSASEAGPVLSGAPLPAYGVAPDLDRGQLLQALQGTALMEEIRGKNLTGAGIGGAVAASGALGSLFFWATRLAWAAAASAAALAAGLLLAGVARGSLRSGEDDLRRRLSPALAEIYQEMAPDVREAARRFSSEIRERHRRAFLSALEDPRRALEARKEALAEDLAGGRQGRTASARQARRVRETEILPLLREVEAFIAEVSAELPAEGDDEPPSSR